MLRDFSTGLTRSLAATKLTDYAPRCRPPTRRCEERSDMAIQFKSVLLASLAIIARQLGYIGQK